MRRPKLGNSLDPREARLFVRAVTEWIGPGFHPDTDMADYVNETGKRCFSKQESAALNRELGWARDVLERGSIDICTIALAVQRRLLRSALSRSKP